jgi:hypothetical protein
LCKGHQRHAGIVGLLERADDGLAADLGDHALHVEIQPVHPHIAAALVHGDVDLGMAGKLRLGRIEREIEAIGARHYCIAQLAGRQRAGCGGNGQRLGIGSGNRRAGGKSARQHRGGKKQSAHGILSREKERARVLAPARLQAQPVSTNDREGSANGVETQRPKHG